MPSVKATNPQETRTKAEIRADRRWGTVFLCVYSGLTVLLVFLYFGLHASLHPAQHTSPQWLQQRDEAFSNTALAFTLFANIDEDVLSSTLASASTETRATVLSAGNVAKFVGHLNAIDKTLRIIFLSNQEALTQAEGYVRDMRNEAAKPNVDAFLLTTQLADLNYLIATAGTQDPYFWDSGWLKWLEVFLWALLGTFIYILFEIQQYFSAQPVGKFRDALPWYVYTTVRGPIITVALIFGISEVSINAGNILDFDLASSSIFVYMFLAVVFGIYSRVAYELLSLMVAKLFKVAWDRAGIQDSFAITPAKADVAFGNALILRTSGPKRLKWDVIPDDFGKIDAGGKYEAPSAADPSKGIQDGTIVTVRATDQDDASHVALAEVSLYQSFQVTGKLQVSVDEKDVPYNVNPVVNGGVVWNVDKEQGQISADGKYTPIGLKPGETVTITATRIQEPKVSAKLQVTITGKADA